MGLLFPSLKLARLTRRKLLIPMRLLLILILCCIVFLLEIQMSFLLVLLFMEIFLASLIIPLTPLIWYILRSLVFWIFSSKNARNLIMTIVFGLLISLQSLLAVAMVQTVILLVLSWMQIL